MTKDKVTRIGAATRVPQDTPAARQARETKEAYEHVRACAIEAIDSIEQALDSTAEMNDALLHSFVLTAYGALAKSREHAERLAIRADLRLDELAGSDDPEPAA